MPGAPAGVDDPAERLEQGRDSMSIFRNAKCEMRNAKGGPALGYAEAGQDPYRRRGGALFASAWMDTHDTESGRGSRQHEDPMTLVQAMRADVPTLQPDVSLREIDVFQLMDALCSSRGAAGPEPEYSRRVRGEP
jgi:hypothetical protein